jgi:hypothetical protein
LEEKMILSRTLIPLCALVIAAPLFLGCTVRESVRPIGPVGGEVVVRQAPPAEVVEVEPAARAGYIWVRGHHAWMGGSYVWVRGHYEVVRAGHAWVAGHWAQRGGGWVWVEGYWR